MQEFMRFSGRISIKSPTAHLTCKWLASKVNHFMLGQRRCHYLSADVTFMPFMLRKMVAHMFFKIMVGGEHFIAQVTGAVIGVPPRRRTLCFVGHHPPMNDLVMHSQILWFAEIFATQVAFGMLSDVR